MNPLTTDEDIEESIALIAYTAKLEDEEGQGSRYWDCFRGKNWHRTEIVSRPNHVSS
jgi:SP family general alpha glucoside:H+ symporter-like MFS transporter